MQIIALRFACCKDKDQSVGGVFLICGLGEDHRKNGMTKTIEITIVHESKRNF